MRHPINRGCGDSNRDECSPEARRIAPALAACGSVSEVADLVHRIFVAVFDSRTAGPPERYARITASIWEEILATGRPSEIDTPADGDTPRR